MRATHHQSRTDHERPEDTAAGQHHWHNPRGAVLLHPCSGHFVVGLSALTGYLDYVLLPALAIFIGLTIYAIQRKRQADACCTPKFNGVKK